MAVVLSALRASRALPPETSSGTHFCLRLSKLQGSGVAGRIRKMENRNE
jgi:hypothetical protein